LDKELKVMDGNEAAAYISYAFTEVSTIYPITPSSPMAEHVDAWAAQGKKNLFGQTVRLVEMQSEAGAIGAMHGSLESGALTTSYTASQGLMLMIPAMYRLSGELLPGVLHVSSRTVGTHAFSIFGDHSDVMACRQTGFAMFSTGSVQEVMDLAAVAHLAAVEGRVPFLHFFDGFRTSHEIQKIEVLDYEELRPLLNEKALRAFRRNALNPDHPVQRSTVQNPDIFFQGREAANPYYEALPRIVEKYIREINRLTGRHYGLFDYYGSPDAERVVVAMGSVSGTAREAVDYLRAKGEKVGYLQVHLFRPFSAEHFLSGLPETVRSVGVLDRTKEPGSLGEPLYEDVCAALVNRENRPTIYGGRYGLSSKDTTPAQIIAVYDNMKREAPRDHFTVGIRDDVTHHSLTVGEPVLTENPDTVSCKFWGFGSDGTVGATQNSVKIIGGSTDRYVQAYFEYDAKKSGGVTKSHLRISGEPIRSTYLVSQADFVACHKASYLGKYDMVSEVKPGGTFLLNCGWGPEELEARLPAADKRRIARTGIRFYTIDATGIAQELGLKGRTNTVLQAAFFRLTGILPIEDAKEQMKKAVYHTYRRKGERVLQMNNSAVDRGAAEVRAVSVPESWKTARDTPEDVPDGGPDFVRNILIPVNALKGDDLPVSAFAEMADGTVPLGTSKYEKRGVAVQVPKWNPENCLQCSRCSFFCPHAAIRPFLLTPDEEKNAPEGYRTVPAVGQDAQTCGFRIQVDPLDCTGCGICEQVCPPTAGAITMQPLDSQLGEAENWEYSLSLSEKQGPENPFTVKNSQFAQPLLEFSGACAGCGETPYMKVLTQLFGDRMYLANATGCSQAWGAAVPCAPYTRNSSGHGPAFSNSLFENNAEFSLGMCLAVRQQREHLKLLILRLLEQTGDEALQSALQAWLDGYDSEEGTRARAEAVVRALEADRSENGRELREEILQSSDHLAKKSMWMYGGDGWAYDIGFGGLDHVLASGEDVNILVVDTEVYSNTGGQSSKATQAGAVAQFAVSGKKTEKKDLGFQVMTYGNVYVAQVAMGADPAQYVKVLREAASYRGPSLIIAYAPCISHGIVKGMSAAPLEAKLAVASGYWTLFRYDPRRKEAGMKPFVLDSREPTLPLEDFLMGEVRFASLRRTFPEQAELLLEKEKQSVAARYRKYRRFAETCD
jgi:pyruvate-ferredoxin/flavodoxin oxidoreductase